MQSDAAVVGPHKHVSNYLAIVAFYGLLVTTLVASIPYATAGIWQKSILVAVIGTLAGFRVIDSVLRGSFRIAEPFLLLPLVGVLCLALIQTLSWPGLASVISADSDETKVFILTLGGLIVGCEVLFFYSTTEHRVKSLIGLVIVVGASSAVFGIARDLYFDTHTDLLATYPQQKQGYAQFLNRNHFVFLAEMVFGLLLGVLIKGGLPDILKFCGWVIAGTLTYAAITANSRGGLISLAALTLLAVPLHILTRNEPDEPFEELDWRSKRKRMILKICGSAALCSLVFALIVTTVVFVGGDKVVTRIERIKDELRSVDSNVVNRKHIWNSTIELIKNQPILGVGFGGYAAAIPRYDKSGGAFYLEQAHNDYLEILANGGIVGFALFGAFGAIVVSRLLRNLKSRDQFTKSCAFGASLGIFGVLIHSFVDFGLHIMINALILAVLVVIGTTTRSVTTT